ncbi:MAG: hypothetical protein AAGF87_01125 [Bacteroidota bacterium]
MRWPGAQSVTEISGLAFVDSCALAHNDSGDGAFLYVLPQVDTDSLVPSVSTCGSQKREIPAGAVDWEDMTTDPFGNWYLGDFGDNRRQRDSLQIYRYSPATFRTDTIVYSYPGGRYHDCEAMVFQGGKLHLFTKAKAGLRRQYWTFHYQVPAHAGYHIATLQDGIYLPRRVVTAADVDSLSGQLILTAYNYKRILGFFPAAASSIISFTSYPGTQFFRGEMSRRNLSWAIPNQVEGISFYDDRYFYVAREKTGPWQARIRRKRRR